MTKTKGELSKKLKVVVGLSGGVDSAVAAALLKQRGYEVAGVFMKFWQAPSDGKGEGGWNRCCSFEAQQRARAVARVLGIPFYVLNLEEQFKKKIVDYFLRELRLGRTPNPCVVCNKEIKFGLLLTKALALGADFVATGHYARKRELKIKNEKLKIEIKNPKLFRAKDLKKDQSYFLWQLNQKQLSRILLPIGEITNKAKVRKLAQKFSLPLAQTKESQEVCFIKDTSEEFLEKYLKEKPGEIQDKNGQILGKHQGLWFYTIGQRKGIGLSGGPYFVIAKDFKKNILIVSKDENDLLEKELIAQRVSWLSDVEPGLPLKVKAKIRYKTELTSALVKEKIATEKYKVVFDKPQRAVTPGQSVVFYLKDELAGGGIIS